MGSQMGPYSCLFLIVVIKVVTSPEVQRFRLGYHEFTLVPLRSSNKYRDGSNYQKCLRAPFGGLQECRY